MGEPKTETQLSKDIRTACEVRGALLGAGVAAIFLLFAGSFVISVLLILGCFWLRKAVGVALASYESELLQLQRQGSRRPARRQPAESYGEIIDITPVRVRDAK